MWLISSVMLGLVLAGSAQAVPRVVLAELYDGGG
jgi:hypothetical protein